VLGILVCGNNHFIVRGPLPDREATLHLARHWNIIQIGRADPIALREWSIVTHAFREDLEWAAVVPGEGEIAPAVTQLLAELAARGIVIQNSSLHEW